MSDVIRHHDVNDCDGDMKCGMVELLEVITKDGMVRFL